MIRKIICNLNTGILSRKESLFSPSCFSYHKAIKKPKMGSTVLVRLISTKRTNRIKRIPTQWSLNRSEKCSIQSMPGHKVSIVHNIFRKMKSQVISTAPSKKYFPDWNVSEIAFAGRSNVGKSSIINEILSQKDLVRTSKTPGRTQAINFFSVGGKPGAEPDISVVDMPGYGFANAPKHVVDEWHYLVGSYVKKRKTLKLVFVLIDSRRGITTLDSEFIFLLNELNVPHQIVLTKLDTVSLAEVDFQLERLRKMVGSDNNTAVKDIVFAVSAKYGYGIQNLRNAIVSAANLL